MVVGMTVVKVRDVGMGMRALDVAMLMRVTRLGGDVMVVVVMVVVMFVLDRLVAVTMFVG